MIPITDIEPDKGLGHALPVSFGLAGLVAVFTLLTTMPSYADSVYSGASVGSDGTVYGWGVTDAQSMTSHTTHMTTTLTSPKGRQATSSPSDGDYTRADVNLPFLSTDTGTYTVVSLSWAFCPVLGRWFWNGVQSQASATVCDFDIVPGSFQALCDESENVVIYTSRLSGGSSCYASPPPASYCSATSNYPYVDIKRGYPVYTVDSGGQLKCQVDFFTTSGGTITPTLTVKYGGSIQSQTKTLQTNISCP